MFIADSIRDAEIADSRNSNGTSVTHGVTFPGLKIALSLCSGRGGAMVSRTRFRDIARACTKLPPNTLVDGEVVAIDENGRNSFNALQQSRTNAHIQVLAHEDVTNSFQSLRARHCS